MAYRYFPGTSLTVFKFITAPFGVLLHPAEKSRTAKIAANAARMAYVRIDLKLRTKILSLSIFVLSDI